MTAPVFSLGELAEQLGATLRGASDIPVRGLASLQEAEADQLSFLANAQYRKFLAETRAGVVLLTAADAEGYAGDALLVANPYLAFAELSHLFDRKPDFDQLSYPVSGVGRYMFAGAKVSFDKLF